MMWLCDTMLIHYLWSVKVGLAVDSSLIKSVAGLTEAFYFQNVLLVSKALSCLYCLDKVAFIH